MITGDGALAAVPADTVLTDRQLLVHLLQHVEEIHSELGRFTALADDLAPLIERARRHGGRGARLFGSGESKSGR